MSKAILNVAIEHLANTPRIMLNLELRVLLNVMILKGHKRVLVFLDNKLIPI